MSSKDLTMVEEKHFRNAEVFSKEQSQGINFELFGISNEIIDGYSLEDDINLLNDTDGFIIF